jgi:hypothetical protein
MANRRPSRQDARGGTLTARQAGELRGCDRVLGGPVAGDDGASGFIGFTVMKIPGGWSNPLYLAPLFVSIVLTYGMFWFVWAYFGALIAFACLAGPYVLAEITGSILPIRIRSILVFVAFVGSILCADMAVHMGELG